MTALNRASFTKSIAVMLKRIGFYLGLQLGGYTALQTEEAFHVFHKFVYRVDH